MRPRGHVIRAEQLNCGRAAHTGRATDAQYYVGLVVRRRWSSRRDAEATQTVCHAVVCGSRAGCGRCNGFGTLPAVFASPWQLWHGRPGHTSQPWARGTLPSAVPSEARLQCRAETVCVILRILLHCSAGRVLCAQLRCQSAAAVALAIAESGTTEARAARTSCVLCRGLFALGAAVFVRDFDARVQLACSAGRVLRAQLPPDSQMWRRRQLPS